MSLYLPRRSAHGLRASAHCMGAWPFFCPHHIRMFQAPMPALLQDSDAAERKSATGAGNGDLNCMGTGMDVACSYDENGQPKAKQITPETLQVAAGVLSLISGYNVGIIATNGRLECVVPENHSTPAHWSSLYESSTHPIFATRNLQGFICLRLPLWDAHTLVLLCGAEMDQTAVAQLRALLLLISPFFFWGTSMVAFKVSTLSPHSLLLILECLYKDAS